MNSFLSFSVDYTADYWNKLWATVRRYAAIYKHTPCKYATDSEKNFAQHVNVYAWSCVSTLKRNRIRFAAARFHFRWNNFDLVSKWQV